MGIVGTKNSTVGSPKRVNRRSTDAIDQPASRLEREVAQDKTPPWSRPVSRRPHQNRIDASIDVAHARFDARATHEELALRAPIATAWRLFESVSFANS